MRLIGAHDTLENMFNSSLKGSNGGKNGGRNGLVAVAIDKDKSSQYALRWAIDNLVAKGQTIILIHVVRNSSNCKDDSGVNDLVETTSADVESLDDHTRQIFVTFHCFCTRKDINCFNVVLEDADISRAIVEYVAHAAIENLVLGASRHGFLRKLKMVDVPNSICKASPDFCTAYVISRSKISSVRNASRAAPFTSPLQLHQTQKTIGTSLSSSTCPIPRHMSTARGIERTPLKPHFDDGDSLKSPFCKIRGHSPSMLPDLHESDSDISFVSSNRPSTDTCMDLNFDGTDSWRNSNASTSSESSFGSSTRSWTKFSELSSGTDFSSSSLENDDGEAEMRRLKIELQKTMEMYSTACREALTAKHKAVELHRWRVDEERRLEEARSAEESARMAVELEKAKYKAAIEDAQAARRVAELESRKRLSAERRALQDSNEMGLNATPLRYRRYTIEEIEEATMFFSESLKIGEGGYGPVFKCHLDHTPVAVKVLRPDAAQGKIQFHQEVEVLSCLRHPNMVLLLGACPEYGCLVYEYMAKGSLEDRLIRRGNTQPLSWQVRFRIAAEVATGLQFLHQTKPEPLVHRDLKPANILLDQNYVSKISDVGLARLVPPSVADDVTQLRLTSAAGTFCYIDPEYQQTGMLGVKSDVYSFGIVLLQLLTGKPAMGLTHAIDQAIEKGNLAEALDPSVPCWPMEEASRMAKLALQCAELRRKDRPDLGKVVLPELNKLREIGDEDADRPFGSSPDSISDTKVVRSLPTVASVYSRTDGSKSSAASSASQPGL